MLGTCSMIPYSEYVRLWGETLGVEATVEPVTVDDFANEWPGGLGIEAGQSAASAQEFGWDGGVGTILPEKAGVRSVDLTDIADYIRQQDWSSILESEV